MMDIEDQRIDQLCNGGFSQVPVIDLSQPSVTMLLVLADACRDWGFFLITGHGISQATLDGWLSDMRSFFALPLAQKRELSRNRDNPWGYFDRELTKNIRDRKEIYDIGPACGHPDDPFAGETPWPAQAGDFTASMQSMAAAMEHLSARLIALIMAGLGAPGDQVAACFRPASSSFLRLNHYPPDDPLADLGQNDAGRGVHHHSDAGAITILLEDGVAGLQVLREGLWHDVQPVPGALIVNIGDMMQIWSNDVYAAPVHRVLAMRGQDRFSAPYFYNPAWNAIIAPLDSAVARSGGSARYRPLPWAEYRRLRADGDFGDYGREVQISDYALDVDT